MSKALIYIVDDDPVYGSTLKKILNVQKYDNVKLFSSGEACIDTLKTRKPGLIILDFRLETLNGLDVLRMIKSSYSKAKVVFLTSLNEDKELQEICEKEGALGFFSKDQQGIDGLIDWMKDNVKSGLFSFLK